MRHAVWVQCTAAPVCCCHSEVSFGQDRYLPLQQKRFDLKYMPRMRGLQPFMAAWLRLFFQGSLPHASCELPHSNVSGSIALRFP